MLRERDKGSRMASTAERIPGKPWYEEPAGRLAPDRLRRLAGEILGRCRGEGPANCVARCPLHVDARGYVGLTREGRFADALRLVREKLPFPGILGYVCTHPCELHCKRIDEDSSIRIRDIKRFLAENEPGEPQHIIDRDPPRGKSVAVVGAGPAGLIAAHDLARRGYTVRLYERAPEIGGCLTRKIPGWRLPRHVVERDLSVIAVLGIEQRTGSEIDGLDGLEKLRGEHGAVLLLPGYEGGLRLLRRSGAVFRRTVRETLWADPVTCATEIDGLFAGGEAVSGPATVIEALAMGRRAAESARRHLEGRDLREGRESPQPAPLLWTLEIDEAVRSRRERKPVLMQPFNPPLSEGIARLEAERCLDCECRICVDDCEFLSSHCESPRELARRVANGFTSEGDLEMVYSCNLCGLCARVCPEGLDTGQLLLEARRRAVAQGRGPLDPQHRRILADLERAVSPAFSLVLSDPGRARSKRLFLPGCELPATSPRETLRLYDELRGAYPGTGVLLYCCGAPATALGLEDRVGETLEEILRQMESVGAEELITACPDCNRLLKERLPDLPVRMVWELLAENWTPPPLASGVTVAVHDPCKTRDEPAVQAAVRQLIQAAGGAVQELEYAGERTRCCGLGGKIEPVDPELARRIAVRRAEESTAPLLTYCSGCRRALRRSGGEAMHLVDLLFSRESHGARNYPTPGRVLRQVNRLRTKWALRRLRPSGAE